MDDFACFTIAIVGGVVVSAVGSILWWLFIFLAARRAYASVSEQMNLLLMNASRELEQLQSLGVGERSVHEARFTALMLKAQNDLRAMDGIRRQQYENTIANMQSQAASAGFIWTPPS